MTGAWARRVSWALLVPCLLCASIAAAQRPKKQKKTKIATQNFTTPSGPGVAWDTMDVDAAVPPVDASTPCQLENVLKSAGERARELVSTLPRFTATERMEHYEADSDGKWSNPKTIVFEYVVEMQQVRKDSLFMDETRDGRRSLERFPARLATTGLPAVAMVFHPFYAGDYAMKCEGLGTWDGHAAWQVHFQQRPDKFPRLRGYHIKDNIYGLKLKGRAWIDAETFQVLHIDTDLLEPVPDIPLLREHLSVDYRPVHFKKENEDLWLQQRAEVYMDYRGHRYLRRHSFSDFLLFSVDVDQKDALPSTPGNP